MSDLSNTASLTPKPVADIHKWVVDQCVSKHPCNVSSLSRLSCFSPVCLCLVELPPANGFTVTYWTVLLILSATCFEIKWSSIVIGLCPDTNAQRFKFELLPKSTWRPQWMTRQWTQNQENWILWKLHWVVGSKTKHNRWLLTSRIRTQQRQY